MAARAGRCWPSTLRSPPRRLARGQLQWTRIGRPARRLGWSPGQRGPAPRRDPRRSFGDALQALWATGNIWALQGVPSAEVFNRVPTRDAAGRGGHGSGEPGAAGRLMQDRVARRRKARPRLRSLRCSGGPTSISRAIPSAVGRTQFMSTTNSLNDALPASAGAPLPRADASPAARAASVGGPPPSNRCSLRRSTTCPLSASCPLIA